MVKGMTANIHTPVVINLNNVMVPSSDEGNLWVCNLHVQCYLHQFNCGLSILQTKLNVKGHFDQMNYSQLLKIFAHNMFRTIFIFARYAAQCYII